MKIQRIIAALILIISALGGYFIYSSEHANSDYRFKLGLDLRGGTHLVYKADVSSLSPEDIGDSMEALRDVVERRVNLFGVSEPVVQVEESGVLGGNEHKLIVELPGVTNIEQAVALIGATPQLDFRLVDQEIAKTVTAGATTTPAGLFVPTGLTGRYLERANIEFNPQTREPVVSLVFNDEGRELFAKITRENIGKPLAIFLDGVAISSPTIQEEIPDGKAQITGRFTSSEVRELVRNLNYGALPVQISLVGTQTIGASLGDEAVHASVTAGFWAFLVVALFLIVWYRLPGLIAAFALAIYAIINLLLFKMLPGAAQITLTAAGIAGFILSLGMAVDANILIFERMKEEMRAGKKLEDALRDGFARAWLSIRDSNLSSILTGMILYFFASTAIIKGFSLVFVIGVLTSMFTAITVSRTLLYAILPKSEGKYAKFLFGNGFTK